MAVRCDLELWNRVKFRMPLGTAGAAESMDGTLWIGETLGLDFAGDGSVRIKMCPRTAPSWAPGVIFGSLRWLGVVTWEVRHGRKL